MKEVYCDYCGRRAEFVDSKVIYGKSYGMIYLCRCCPGYAYVGVHKGTDRPLGRLADMELRELKNLAHAAFDPLWKEGRFKGHRKAAYAWLSEQMGLPQEKTHIGMFDTVRCERVVQICQEERSRQC